MTEELGTGSGATFLYIMANGPDFAVTHIPPDRVEQRRLHRTVDVPRPPPVPADAQVNPWAEAGSDGNIGPRVRSEVAPDCQVALRGILIGLLLSMTIWGAMFGIGEWLLGS